MIECNPINFYWFLCSFGLPSCALVTYHRERKLMLFHDTVGVNGKKGATADIKT